LLFSGPAGTGKTTLAKLLLNELEVDPGDVLELNGSVINGVDEVRNRIVNFATTLGFGEFRYIFYDEADYLSHNAQAALRGVMEKYSNTCRFILTCNFVHKIIPPIHSRCQGFHIEKLDPTEFMARVATILIAEDVNFDIEVLDMYVSATYPDMRKCINLCQQNSQTGSLQAPSVGESSEKDYKLEMIALFRARKYREGRTLICNQIGQEEYEDVYRFFYQNLNLWADTTNKENEAILIIRNGLVKHTACADPEINLSACLVELEILANS
jgi:replication factor C small subunit